MKANKRGNRFVVRTGILMVFTMLTVLMSAERAEATVYSWNNPLGGDWNQGFNWTLAGVPGSGDTARFYDALGVFTVQLTNDVTSVAAFGQSTPDGLDVTFDLGGTTFTQSAILNINNEVVWRVKNGTFLVSSGSTLMGATNDLGWQSADLILDTGCVFRSSSSGFVTVGYQYTASLTVQNGGMFDMRSAPTTSKFYIGRLNGSHGTVLVSGADSSFWVGTNITTLGELAGAEGRLIVENGGLFSTYNSMYVGQGGSGQMIIRDGGQVLNKWRGGIAVGYDSPGTGLLIVSGAMSRAVIGDFSSGYGSGTGVTVVADGGSLESYRQMKIGAGSTTSGSAEGTLIVTGTNSALRRFSGPVDGKDVSLTTYLGVGAVTYNPGDWNATGLVTTAGYLRGHGALIVEDGGVVDIDARIAVFSNSSVRVDGGQTRSDQIGFESNSTFTAVLRLGYANAAEAMMVATNEVRIYGATLKLELGSDFVYHYGDIYPLISFGRLNSGFDRFDGIDQLGIISVGGIDFEMDYGFYEENVINIMAIPEPGLFGLLGSGLCLAIWIRRRIHA